MKRKDSSRFISVASGKGGVGKSTCVINLACSLSAMGKKVCVIDADLGLSNVDVLLGLNPECTLEDVLFEGQPLENAIIETEFGFDLLPGGSGVVRLAEMSSAVRKRMLREFEILDGYDFVVVDNSPGITSTVTALCHAADTLVLVITPDATSLTDAYALAKILKEQGMWQGPQLLINQAPSFDAGKKVFAHFRKTAQRYLGFNCSLLTIVPVDKSIGKAALAQLPVRFFNDRTIASRSFDHAASMLTGMEGKQKALGGTDEFIGRMTVRIQEYRSTLEKAASSLENRGGEDFRELIDGLRQELTEVGGDLDKLERLAPSHVFGGIVRRVRQKVSALGERLVGRGKSDSLEQEDEEFMFSTVEAPSVVVLTSSESMNTMLFDVLEVLEYEPLGADGVGSGNGNFSPAAAIVYDVSHERIQALHDRIGDVPVVQLVRRGTLEPEIETLSGSILLELPFQLDELREALQSRID